MPLLAGVFSNSISLGTGLIGLLLFAFAAYFAWRNKALASSQGIAADANEQANQWRENYLAERQLNEDKQSRAAELLAETNARWAGRFSELEARYAEQRDLKDVALAENASLKMATDLTVVMRELGETRSDLLGRLAQAEERIAKQMALQTAVLEGIVKRLEIGSSEATSTTTTITSPTVQKSVTTKRVEE